MSLFKRGDTVKRIISILLLSAALCAVAAGAGTNAHVRLLDNCTGLIAGRNTTADGSIIFAKTEDDGEKDVDFLWYIPRRQHEPGSVVKLQNGGAVPQVEETYAYLWDQCPGTSFSNNIVNEWGVALGSNACPSREDEVEEVAARGDLVDGGLAFELRIILGERAKTAREAVEIAARLLDTYGYNASGRCLHIVGPDEAWQLQMVRGKQYVARRVQDDEVAIIANTYTIRGVDPEDRENFICSPRLIEYAIERGWYDPGSGKPFDFAAAYAHPDAHTGYYNTDRHWGLARLLVADFPISWEEARKGVLPVSVKPDGKLALRDVMDIFRDHYEGTALDSTGGYGVSPHLAPGRPICCQRSHRTTIIQQRNWLPRDIGTVVWRAQEPPCASVFVPWYLGITRIPPAFQMAPFRADTTSLARIDFHFDMPPETWRIGLESSGELFKTLRRFIDYDYASAIREARMVWDRFESMELDLQPAIEEAALDIYGRDRGKAREFLTLYSNALAEQSLHAARQLIEGLQKTREKEPQADRIR
jgi:dipeptidase